MKTEGNIAMLILAAGESKRMNDIKQLLPWKNTFSNLFYNPDWKINCKICVLETPRFQSFFQFVFQ